MLPFATKADTLWLNRGQTYGTINVVSGRVYAATGIGANPIVSGFKSITTWTSLGGNVWQSEAVSVRPNIVLINGVNKLPARYPNSGYLTYETSSQNTIKDNELTGTWIGGEVAVRKVEWVFDKGVIVAQNGTTLTYSNISGDFGTNGWGYFIQNHPSAMDQQGEWCYSNGKLLVYSTSQPINVKYSSVSTLADGNGGTFINIDFEGSNEFSIKGSNKLIGCNVKYSGSFGIYASNSNGIVLDNCTFENTNNVPVLLNSCPNSQILNSKFINNGIEGQGQGLNVTSLEYSGISLSNCNGTIVQGNEIINTGYNGIDFYSGGYTVKNNYIEKFNTIKDDGGAIYTYQNTTASTIEGNIIVDGIGAAASRNDIWYVPSYGIYLDDGTANVQVIGNTITKTAAAGIYIHNASNLSIKDNTAYNCGVSPTADEAGFTQILFVDNGTNNRNISMIGNKFIARTANQNALKMDTKVADFGLQGLFDSNYYCRPLNDNITIRLYSQTWPTTNFYNISQWKSLSNQDIHSSKSAKSVNSLDSIRFEYTLGVQKNITLSGTWVDVTGKSYTSVTLKPYTSICLLYKSPLTALALEQWIPIYNPRQVHNSMYDRFGNYLKINKNCMLVFYSSDGKTLKIVRGVKGQTVEIPYMTFYIKPIETR